MGNSIQNKCDKYHNTVYTKIENNQMYLNNKKLIHQANEKHNNEYIKNNV